MNVTSKQIYQALEENNKTGKKDFVVERETKAEQTSPIGIIITIVIQAIMLVLKMFLPISWLWVLSPTWIHFGLFVIAGALYFLNKPE